MVTIPSSGGFLSARAWTCSAGLGSRWLFVIGFLSAVFLTNLQRFWCNFQWLF
jgi:hypothetical protein